MRKNSRLGFPHDLTSESYPSNWSTTSDWFSCGNYSTIMKQPFYVQDTTHIGTKLRNFLLKTKANQNKLPFGKKQFISMHHFDFLLNEFSKAEHMLCATTLNPVDRQNFSSVLRMCDTKVTNLMRKHVKNSEGTVKFLEIMRDVIAAYMDNNLTPLERIKKYWYALFILRFWRNYVISRKKLTLKNNFLTQNCFSCIELNAHSLVLLLIYLKENNMPELFMPNLYSSQPCESTFRLVRSFTSTYSTVANCSVKEVLERISKIQLQSDIATLNAENFNFPRISNASNGTSNVKFEMPTAQEIYEQIEVCRTEAVEYAWQIGLIKNKNSTYADVACKIVPYVPKPTRKSDNKNQNSEHIVNEYLYEKLKLSLLLKGGSFKNYADIFSSKYVDETGPYVEIDNTLFDRKNKTIVKKTFLCWLLRSNNRKLSSDRLQRVKSKITAQPKINYLAERRNLRQSFNYNLKPYRKKVKY